MRNVPIRDIARHLGVVCESDAQVTGYEIDSRRVGPGCLFFALKGEKTDGHRYLAEVKGRGAVGAVVSRGYEGEDFGLILLPVEDPEESLRELAKHDLGQAKTQIVAVTGSVGKTTTKEFIGQLLSGKYRVGKTEGSYNTKLTLPITVLNRSGEEEVLVLEMGMTEMGDIERLVQIAPPDIALLTKVAMAHVANFPGGVPEIAKGKAQIFSQPKTRAAVFDHGLYEFPEAMAQIGQGKISFSLENRNADYFLSFSEGKCVVDERGVRACSLDLPFRQAHFLHNLLAAFAVARWLKMEWDEIKTAAEKLELPKMRFEQFEREGVLFVNDAYNANPESMKAALMNFPAPKEGGKRIAVLGTMVELGTYSEGAHLEMGRLAHRVADHLLAYGAEAAGYCAGFDEAKKPAEHFSDQESLAKRLRELMCPGDTVLVKGSRKMQLENLFELLPR